MRRARRNAGKDARQDDGACDRGSGQAPKTRETGVAGARRLLLRGFTGHGRSTEACPEDMRRR
jgi:hypothetical protein